MAEYNEYVAYKPNPKKTKTPQQALSALMALCSRAEKSSGDALRLMREWGLDDAQARDVLSNLQSGKYIDDSRYAEAFVRDKMSFSSWGKFKITQALIQKGISKDIIDRVMGALDNDFLKDRLEQMLLKKMKATREADPYKLKNKLIRSGASAGYELSVVVEVVNRLIQTQNEYEM